MINCGGAANRRAMVKGLTHIAFKLRWVALTAAVVIFAIVFWDVFVWDVLRWVSDILLAVATAINKILVWVITRPWWLIKGLWTILTAVWRAGVTVYDKIVWFVTSPWLILATGGFFLACLLCLKVESGEKNPSFISALLVFAVITLGLATLFLLLYWIANAPFPEIHRLFQVP